MSLENNLDFVLSLHPLVHSPRQLRQRMSAATLGAMTLAKGNTNPFLLSRPELISAKKKIALVSSTYDPMKTNLKGFEVYSLSPTEFREQLRQTCQIILTSEELGALAILFDRVSLRI
jgi:hypothetical protein